MRFLCVYEVYCSQECENVYLIASTNVADQPAA
jgi:hypothetical protein